MLTVRKRNPRLQQQLNPIELEEAIVMTSTREPAVDESASAESRHIRFGRIGDPRKARDRLLAELRKLCSELLRDIRGESRPPRIDS